MKDAVTMRIKISPKNAKVVRLMAALENKKGKDNLEQAIASNVTQEKESLEILAQPDWVEQIKMSQSKHRKGETMAHEELKRRLSLVS